MKNSDLRLDDDVRTLLERELDADVPDPNSPDFQAFLEDIQVERPDLFDEVMRGLQVNVTLPVEKQAQQAARRDSINEQFTRAFFQRSKVDGEAIPAKRRIITYVFGLAAFLLPVMYILAQTFQFDATSDIAQEQSVPLEPEPGSLNSQSSVSLQTPLEPEVPIPEPEPRAVVTFPDPEPEPSEPTPSEPRQAAPSPPRQQAAAPRPPSPTPTSAPTPPAPTPPAPSPTPPAPTPSPSPQRAPAPTVPEPAEVLPGTLELYRAQYTAPRSVELYQAPQPPGNLRVYQQESVPPASLNLLGASGEQAPPQETVLFDLNAQAQEGGAPTSPITGGGNTEGQPSLPAAQSQSIVASPSEPAPFTLPLGSRIQATLATGIFVAEGAAVPVVAHSRGDWCTEPPCPEITWIGQARLDATNRVQVNFTQALLDGSLQNVTALALNPDSSNGLRADLRDEASLSAENLLRNGAAGVSDYVDALVNQQTVTFTDRGIVTENTVPEADAFIAARIASLFDSPVARGPTLRIAEIPADTPLLVLYGVNPQLGQPSEQP